MNKIAKLMVSFSFAFLTVFSVGAVSEITNPVQEVSAGTSIFDSGDSVNSAEANNNVEGKKIVKSIYSAANVFAGFVLAVSILMIILGGLKYIMANGDPRQAESGKMILIYSGIGIVIALSAFVIARLFAGFSV